MPDGTGYVLDNSHVEAGQRFEVMSRLFDPWTLRHVDALGIQRGWRCWEVGAGGPNVPGQLATAAEIDRHLDNVTSGRLDLTMPPLVTAAGRKPGSRSVH